MPSLDRKKRSDKIPGDSNNGLEDGETNHKTAPVLEHFEWKGALRRSTDHYKIPKRY